MSVPPVEPTRLLLESEERFRLLVQSVVDYGIFMLDPQGYIASWNIGAQRIKGYRADEIIGQHFSVFYPPEDAGKPALELETAKRDGRLEDEGWRLRKDGTRFWANVVITALFDDTGELRGFGKVTRDLTERRNAELRLSERRLLLAHLVEAQETERRRIAWDVHDDSVQAMIAVGMRLQLLADDVPAEYAQVLRELDEAVDSTINRLRHLVFRLRPPGIDQHGLVEALTSYTSVVLRDSELRLVLHNELDQEPPAVVAITIFRICQEALTNVLRHANAKTVHISLSTVDDGALVRVTDDGKGFEPAVVHSARGREHFGLIEMRERAETAGGWWTVAPDREGTTVEFWLPFVGSSG
ncbi:PAS domain S-box protein [Lentzea tibetensis]|uniref:PAS domain S-box protein n=1 Tax=Lentzea tibetensis TaxID=2591470 RepID=A0A563EW39_9PSEU|nr:PAS domain-containing sensor histidine kinase [Lentzea tibetensis]TWP51691.1 PAS domain S-box protein [Lentzea tibetensis]